MISASPGVWATCATAVCGFALWKGGPSERCGAVLVYGAWIATRIVHDPDRFATQWAVLAVDVAALVLLTILALRSRKYWPIFIAAFELLGVVTHIGHILDPTMGAWAYLTAAQIWGYLILLALAVGARNAWRERDHPAISGDPVTEPAATRR